MTKIWSDHAWDDYIYWQQNDKNIIKRINQILKDIERNAYEGIGKPEPLKYEWQGYWSRRIDSYHRLVYRVIGGKLEIVQCRAHYDN
ncbi:MAG: Txe/YoeB family addiction module toxin [Deferribacteraceae bacterium]|jgi:toxin YoeB|nr:Txe/YoeB family addiction module toxin [Deferribacteraceae bacterium]